MIVGIDFEFDYPLTNELEIPVDIEDVQESFSRIITMLNER
jgi:adenylylsulfate kinase-like enzyme